MAGYNYDLIAPPELILAGRLVAAALGLGTVALAGAIAFKFRNRLAGFLAILFTGLCPALVLRGSNVIVDTFATFFAMLALYFAERLRSNSQHLAIFAAASGLAAGLAFASKYTAGAVIVSTLLILWMHPAAFAARVRFTFMAAAGLFVGVLAGAPASLFNWRAAWHHVGVTAANYFVIDSKPGYFGQAVTFELGWFLALASLTGLALMLRDRSTRPTACAWSLFGVALLAIFLGKPFQPFRNLLPLVPPLCIAAAFAFTRLIAWARPSVLRVTVAILLISIAAGTSLFASLPRIQYRRVHSDSRVQAMDWLQRHTAPGQKVLGIRELAILPAEWRRLSASTTVVSLCEVSKLLEREHFHFVVAGDFDLRHALDRDAASACLSNWKDKSAPLMMAAEFGSGPTFVVPYVWRTNDQRVLILKP